MQNKLAELLEGKTSVAIGGHVRPDGDCVGACMGLYQYLRDNYRDVETDVYLEEIPSHFSFVEGTGDIRHQVEPGKTYDLFICLDCGDAERLGFSGPLFESAAQTFCVDHHISNQAFADENYIVPDASSTSELVFRLLDCGRITRGIAEALYIGIVHDTGVFQYSCAGPETFRTAAALLEKGVDAPSIIERTYYEKSYAQNQILGRALLESIVFMHGQCIFSSVSQAVMRFYGVTPKELDGIVSQLRITKGVEVAIFLYEQEPNVYKVSLRSKEKVDVSRVAAYFGGGGHVKAAGCTMPGTVHDVINNLARQIAPQLETEETKTEEA